MYSDERFYAKKDSISGQWVVINKNRDYGQTIICFCGSYDSEAYAIAQAMNESSKIKNLESENRQLKAEIVRLKVELL